MARYAAGHGKLFRSKVKGKAVGSWKFTFHGQRISTGTKDKRLAEGFRRRWLAKQTTRRPARGDALRIRDLLRLVEQDYRRRGRRSTWQLPSHFRPVMELFGNHRADDFGPAEVADFVDQRLLEGVKPSTINMGLAMIRRGFRLAAEMGMLVHVPIIRDVECNNARHVDCTYGEYTELLTHLENPYRLMTVLAYHIGWRSGRLRELTWPQVDLENDLIRKPPNQPQNKWVGDAPIFGDMRPELLRARARRDETFPSCPWVIERGGEQIGRYTREWERARRAIGRPELRFHDLRHCAVTTMLEAGIGESRVMQIVGHRSNAMIRRYMLTSGKRVQEAGERLEAYFRKQQQEGQGTGDKGQGLLQ